MNLSEATQPFTKVFTPLVEALVRGLGKEECYSFLTGFAISVIYFTYFYLNPISFLRIHTLPIWVCVIGLVGFWIVTTGIVFGIGSIIHSIVEIVANRFGSLKALNEESNGLVSKHVGHYAIASRFYAHEQERVQINLHHTILVCSGLIILIPLCLLSNMIIFSCAVALGILVAVVYYYRFIAFRRYFLNLRSLWAISWPYLSEEKRTEQFEDSMKLLLK